MSEFEVDPRLIAVGHHAADWPLSRVFVYNDSRYPWAMLVPRRAGAVEICDLSKDDQQQLMKEISDLSKVIRTIPSVEKINVGCLGNVVLQMHVHIVGRHKADTAWPATVWFHSAPVPWPDISKSPLALALQR